MKNEVEEYQGKIIKMIGVIDNIKALKVIYRLVHKYFINKWARKISLFLFFFSYKYTF